MIYLCIIIPHRSPAHNMCLYDAFSIFDTYSIRNGKKVPQNYYYYFFFCNFYIYLYILGGKRKKLYKNKNNAKGR